MNKTNISPEDFTDWLEAGNYKYYSDFPIGRIDKVSDFMIQSYFESRKEPLTVQSKRDFLESLRIFWKQYS